jgi:hypothetical protein
VIIQKVHVVISNIDGAYGVTYLEKVGELNNGKYDKFDDSWTYGFTPPTSGKAVKAFAKVNVKMTGTLYAYKLNDALKAWLSHWDQTPWPFAAKGYGTIDSGDWDSSGTTNSLDNFQSLLLKTEDPTTPGAETGVREIHWDRSTGITK